MTSRSINLIKIPSDVGSVIKGKSLAPEALINAGFKTKLQKIGFNVTETNALPGDPATWSASPINANGARNEEANVQVCSQVRNAVSAALRVPDERLEDRRLLVLLGGECCMLPGVLAAFWDQPSPQGTGMIYVDGDADLQVPGAPGSSGNMASMTLTHLTLRNGALESMKHFTRPDGSALIDSNNIVLFGLNAGLPGNKRDQLAYLFDEGYRVVTSSAVAEDPLRRAQQALGWLEERVNQFVLHLDVDAIDAGLFPLANVANNTGAGYEEIMAAVKVFLASRKLKGLVVAEVNPDHDPGLKMTTRLVDDLVEGIEQQKQHA